MILKSMLAAVIDTLSVSEKRIPVLDSMACEAFKAANRNLVSFSDHVCTSRNRNREGGSLLSIIR